MQANKPLLFVLGTRPEGIKLLPLVWECQARVLPFELLHTAQHEALLDALLQANHQAPDYKLSAHPNTLLEAKQSILSQMEASLPKNRYSAILVQGDTLSALCGAEYGFFRGIPVIHIEAGMRTYQNEHPYPEEVFRRMIAPMATLHFCPSEDEAKNLKNEGICEDSIFVTGNTFPDYWNTHSSPKSHPKKQILVTIHRRENLPYLEEIFDAIAKLAQRFCAYEWLFPLHPNPTLVECAARRLSGIPNLRLTNALPPEEFFRELCASETVLTDSGGVQEECIFLGKKVLVVRTVSERRTDFPFVRRVDPKSYAIEEAFSALFQTRLTETPCSYYGVGGAAKAIAEILAREL